MSEIQHTSRAHARLNASSSHRWMMCPPSVKLSEQFEDKPSTYAEEGTFLHELCELKLHRYLSDMTAEVVEAQYAEHRDSEFYSDETESVTDEYVAFCIETIEAQPPGAFLAQMLGGITMDIRQLSRQRLQ